MLNIYVEFSLFIYVLRLILPPMNKSNQLSETRISQDLVLSSPWWYPRTSSFEIAATWFLRNNAPCLLVDGEKKMLKEKVLKCDEYLNFANSSRSQPWWSMNLKMKISLKIPTEHIEKRTIWRTSSFLYSCRYITIYLGKFSIVGIGLVR